MPRQGVVLLELLVHVGPHLVQILAKGSDLILQVHQGSLRTLCRHRWPCRGTQPGTLKAGCTVDRRKGGLGHVFLCFLAPNAFGLCLLLGDWMQLVSGPKIATGSTESGAELKILDPPHPSRASPQPSPDDSLTF